jgi:hypothetical protein
MGIDDSSLELCPLCFYDLDGPRPDETGFDEVLAPEASRTPGIQPISLGSPLGLDALIAIIPLIVLMVVLAVALIER